jgi:hypothetical protein
MLGKERFTLTTPKIKGVTVGYFRILEAMYNGKQISKYRNINMSIQALREKGLCEAKNRKGYVITPKGRAYVDYVNSTSKPLKLVLRGILSARNEKENDENLPF